MFDGVSSSLTAVPSVLVAGDRIAGVRGPGEPLPAGVQVIDLPGLTLMPGLIDAHVHLCFDASDDPVGHLVGMGDEVLRRRMADAARRALRAGVTTVRDLGDRGYLALDLRDGASGGTLTPGSLPHEPQFGAESLRAIVDEAHRHGLPVSPAPDVPADVAVH